MATEKKQSWGTRSKRTSVVALGLVAILAGVAVAYFLTSQKFANNQAVGGSLTVDATLPIDFTDEPLYPTTKTNSDYQFAEKEFTITNNNSVNTRYQLFATCEECIPDPADTPAAADARAQKDDQYKNLMIKIFDPAPPSTPPGSIISPPKEKVYYEGKLSDLGPTTPADLGIINTDTDHTFTVRLWLENDATRAQPQAVQNIWEFFVNAKTPAA
jgi:hypothetical protein